METEKSRLARIHRDDPILSLFLKMAAWGFSGNRDSFELCIRLNHTNFYEFVYYSFYYFFVIIVLVFWGHRDARNEHREGGSKFKYHMVHIFISLYGSVQVGTYAAEPLVVSRLGRHSWLNILLHQKWWWYEWRQEYLEMAIIGEDTKAWRLGMESKGSNDFNPITDGETSLKRISRVNINLFDTT